MNDETLIGYLDELLALFQAMQTDLERIADQVDPRDQATEADE